VNEQAGGQVNAMPPIPSTHYPPTPLPTYPVTHLPRYPTTPMILDLLLAPVTAPINGMTWIASKILEQAEPLVDEKENLKKELLALQLAFDMGELPEDEFEEREEALLLAIQALEDEELDAEDED